MRRGVLLLTGLLWGALIGFAFLESGTFAVIPGSFASIWLAVRRPPLLGLAGVLIGVGGSWLVLLSWACWSCAHDTSCLSQPDISLWLVVAGLLVPSGAIIGIQAWRTTATR